MTLSTSAVLNSPTIPPRSVGIEVVLQWLMLREVRTKDDDLRASKAELETWTGRLERAADLMTEFSRARDSVTDDTKKAVVTDESLQRMNAAIDELGLEGYFTTTGYTGVRHGGKYLTDREIYEMADKEARAHHPKNTNPLIISAFARQRRDELFAERGTAVPGGVDGTNNGRAYKTAVIRLQTELEKIGQQHGVTMGETNEKLQVMTAFINALSSLLQKMTELTNRSTGY